MLLLLFISCGAWVSFCVHSGSTWLSQNHLMKKQYWVVENQCYDCCDSNSELCSRNLVHIQNISTYIKHVSVAKQMRASPIHFPPVLFYISSTGNSFWSLQKAVLVYPLNMFIHSFYSLINQFIYISTVSDT